jgi:CXXX repeat modification system protein
MDAKQRGKKILGKVSKDEKNEIERIFERENGLKELEVSVKDKISSELYNKIFSDFCSNHKKMVKWWQDIRGKYNWESPENAILNIDFNTREVFFSCEE